MSKNNDIVRRSAEHVFGLFRGAARDGALVYHGFDRARSVASACKEIAKGCKLDDEQTQIAMLAAWFYDAGYAAGPNTDRQQSVEMLRAFLAEQGEPAELADAVEACMTGSQSYTHETLAQEVLHDALLVPMADKSFLRKLGLLRLEKERRGGVHQSDVEWTEACILYLDQHPFRTRYAQIEYNAGRAENVVRLHKLLRKQQAEAAEERAEQDKASKGLGKTVEGIFSEMTKTQLKLLNVSDRRTSTMIHVNAIMISLIVGLLLRKMDEHRDLLVPTLVLLGVNLIVIFISIFSMRIGRSLRPLLGEDTPFHDENLLVMTNHVPLTREEYHSQIDALVQDVPAMRRKMIESIYYSRKLLATRAGMLRLTYDVFIVGLLVSVVVFGVAIIHR